MGGTDHGLNPCRHDDSDKSTLLRSASVPMAAPNQRRRAEAPRIDIIQSSTFPLFHLVRKWRNWQTRKPQELVGAIQWGFESPLPHQSSLDARSARSFGWPSERVAHREGGLVTASRDR